MNCTKHPRYRAKKIPTADCRDCWALYWERHSETLANLRERHAAAEQALIARALMAHDYRLVHTARALGVAPSSLKFLTNSDPHLRGLMARYGHKQGRPAK